MYDPSHLAEYQFTRAEAIQFGSEERWRQMSDQERAIFQLRQENMCMPFGEFHRCVTDLLGRDVYTHEFARPDLLWDEWLGKIAKPDLEAILAKLPKGTEIIIVNLEKDDG